MNRQPLEIQTLYAELLEQLLIRDAQRQIGDASGTFTLKNVKGKDYYYFQHSVPGGRTRQSYLGPRTASLDELVQNHAQGRKLVAADDESLARLAALLRAGGAIITDASSARVIRALADSGVFALGGVLVGTHAFSILGNVLGVRWDSGMRTQDIDVAATKSVEVGIVAEPADVPSVIESLEMGFLPVPSLNRAAPSTSFKVRGQALRVDLLTPASGEDSAAPVQIPRLRAAAQPLKYLDYVVEAPVNAAMINGGATLVRVPDPARFALHKLIVAAERPAAWQSKREKDLFQAAALLDVLFEDRQGDVSEAWDALAGRGSSWSQKARESVAALNRVAPTVAQRLESL